MPKDSFGGHGDVDPRKTKWEQQKDDKGRDSRKKALEKQRALERMKQSSSKERERERLRELSKQRDITGRLNKMLLERQRHARGMTHDRWDHYLKTHDGKTPDRWRRRRGRRR